LATVEAFAITGPGAYPLGDGRVLSAHLADNPREEGINVVELCGRQVGFPLQVRAPRPGDRLQPTGMTGTRKLQDLFVDLKIPVEDRCTALLVFGADRLLWVAGIRRCEGLRPAATGPVLRLELTGSVTR
jgi:tRNA(Ile)-lysidine synthase